MKKFAILAGLMALALVIGVAGTTFRADKAEARPTDVIAFNPDVCAFLTAGDTDCWFLNLTGLGDVAHDLKGDVDDPDTYKDLVDASAAQLGRNSIEAAGMLPNLNSQSMWVVVFATNGDDVTLNADEGIWLSGTGAGTSTTTQTPNADNMVINLLYAGATAPLHLGDAIVTATQDGIDVEMDYTVVGDPDDFALTATKTTIQEYSGADCDLADAADEVGLPDVSLLIGKVVDKDGTELTGIWADWDSSDTDAVDLAEATTVSMVSDAGTAALDLACGDEVGESTITAEVSASIDDEIDITVVGAPASMTLAANPPSITCNGTNSAEVTATILDADGKPVVAGNKVRFEVLALGTANPIVAKTDANGVAKSTITPLSGVTAGVTVLVSVVDDPTIEGNILVACQPAVPTVVPTVTPPVVTPPVTGDGGYLP
jgi:hypothetical protein